MTGPGRAGPSSLESPPRRRNRLRWIVVGAAAVVLVASAVVGALYLLGDSESAPPTPGEPEVVSVDRLRSFAADRDAPVYWAGEIPDRSLELTRTGRGDVYVRYLTEDAEAGDERAVFTTVGTYPQPDAYAYLTRTGRRDGYARTQAPARGIAVWDVERPTSVYVTYPGANYVVEVYDPNERTARGLVLSGEVEPVS